MDDVERRKILPFPGLELRPSAVQPVTSPYTDFDIPTLLYTECGISQLTFTLTMNAKMRPRLR
jgi:hypothetical protein